MPDDRFAPFRYRDYRVVWAGNTVSIIGSQMTTASLILQIHALAGDPVLSGLLGVCRALPIFMFAAMGGVLADSLDRRRTVITTKFMFTAISGSLAYLSAQGTITVPWIFGLMAASALTNTVDNPAQRALVFGLVPKDLLPQAIAFNMLTFQFACVLGPALGGLVYAWKGPALVYLLDAVSFLFVIAAFLFLHFRPAKPSKVRISVRSYKEGFHFLAKKPILWNFMLIDFIATFFSSLQYMIPFFGKDILHAGDGGTGLLLSAIALGTGLGAAFFALNPIRKDQGRVMLGAVACFGFSILGFGLSRSFLLSFFFLALSGFLDAVSVVLRQGLSQIMTPDRLRGRLSAINMMFFAVGPQLGEVKTGILAGFLGAPVAAALGGGATVLLAAGYWLKKPLVRDFSLKLGRR